MARPYASAIERSFNSKLTSDPKKRPMSVTMASQHTCPTVCPLRNNGCYAEQGPMGIQTHRLNKDGILSADDFARCEADAIDGLTGRNMLRLHEVGDCTTDSSARILADAAERYIDRARIEHGIKDQKVYGYTHAWRDIERDSWGPISILASCENEADVLAATSRGYACAIVAMQHKDIPSKIGTMSTLPCPQQTGQKADCYSCRACMHDNRLYGKGVIVFAVHGNAGKKRIPAVLAAKTNLL
jgi:hypothetical protein